MDSVLLESWIFVIALAAGIVVVPVWIAQSRAERWNQLHVPRLEEAVSSLVREFGPISSCIEASVGLNILVSAAHLHLLDEKTATVRRSVPIEAIDTVTVHDRYGSGVAFTMRCNGDESWPVIRVSSLAAFATLFNVLIDFGRIVRFDK